jgi:hypothetical protein
MGLYNQAMDRLIQACAQYQPILQEYQKLFLKKQLTEQDANRLDQIFAQAMEDGALTTLIDELDHALGHQLNMIDTPSVEQSRCEWVRLLDQEHIDLTIANASSPELRDAQKQLEKEGYYNGIIDGVYGPKTQNAFQKLREAIKSLSQQGIPPETWQLLEMEKQFISFC